MSIDRFQTVIMTDNDIFTISATALILNDTYLTVKRSTDCIAYIYFNIQTVMRSSSARTITEYIGNTGMFGRHTEAFQIKCVTFRHDGITISLQNVRNGSASPEEVAANAQYNYYSYVILFRDVIYNGGGNTLPINLSYLDTAKPLQQFSVTLGQCVDKDQTTSPNLLVRTSSYGDSVTAGQAFDLSLGLYATDGNENLDDVIVSLTLPENISLNGGSLSSYLGTICPKQTRDVTFQVMPASGFTGTVASITVNMTGTGSVTGKEVSGTTTISVPVSQPDRFEVGQLELSGDTIYVGDTGSVSLSYVNKGKNPVSNLEARLTGTNLGAGGYQYLGNLAAGTEGSVDFDIVPDAAGTVSGIITLNYEDASGNPQTFSKDFSVSAEEMNMDDFNYDPSMDDVQPEQTGMPVWAWVLIGVCGAVVVIVVIVVVVRKRKKAKALAALEAEDSDEDL